ncbi:MAG: helix-turn-helix domain-containing protein [Actinomycetota bacterium]|nr:helix-turn-helix domain-containing protein [Actinomycetota bacterium]
MVVGQLRTDDARRTDRLFHALADATRRDIVTRTLGSERSVSELARLYPMSFAAVQKHVAVLTDAGLVSKYRRGREQLVRGEVGRVRDVHRLLDELETAWRDRLDRFGAVLAHDLADHAATEATPPPDPRPRRKQP